MTIRSYEVAGPNASESDLRAGYYLRSCAPNNWVNAQHDTIDNLCTLSMNMLKSPNTTHINN